MAKKPAVPERLGLDLPQKMAETDFTNEANAAVSITYWHVSVWNGRVRKASQCSVGRIQYGERTDIDTIVLVFGVSDADRSRCLITLPYGDTQGGKGEA